MKGNGGTAAITLLVMVALTSLFSGTASAQAISPAYVGKFTLTAETHWGKAVLQPGSYTITIESTGCPIIALIRNANGDAFTYETSGAQIRNHNGLNALLVGEKHGQLTVHSLALAELGIVLVYDHSLAREKTQYAQQGQAVPVEWAKK
jgi:hypothetical protein